MERSCDPQGPPSPPGELTLCFPPRGVRGGGGGGEQTTSVTVALTHLSPPVFVQHLGLEGGWGHEGSAVAARGPDGGGEGGAAGEEAQPDEPGATGPEEGGGASLGPKKMRRGRRKKAGGVA